MSGIEGEQTYYQKHREKIIAYSKKYYQDNKIKVLERTKEYSRKNKKNHRAYKLKYRDKNKNVPELRFALAKRAAKTRELSWVLTKEIYCEIVKKVCYYCSNEFGDTNTNCGIGLDRLDNSIGYEIGNVVSCCAKCNFIRGTILSPEETYVAIQAILQYRKGTS